MTAIRAAMTGIALVVTGATAAFAADFENPGPLASPDWVQAHLDQPGLVVLDIRGGADGTYADGHVPGAIASNYGADGWRVEQNGVPGMLPELSDLEALIGGLGIGNDDHVVVVPAGTGSSELGAATRVYWTFKVLGHDDVSILDGGYTAWTAAELPVSTEVTTPSPDSFTANFRPELLASAADVSAAIADGTTLIDARPVEQYLGLAQHPRAQSLGTIPGALNTPQEALATIDGNRMRDAQTLDYLFSQAGIEAEAPAIAFCNTGHWASIAWFARSELLGQETSLYDGSMVEWTANPDNPITALTSD